MAENSSSTIEAEKAFAAEVYRDRAAINRTLGKGKPCSRAFQRCEYVSPVLPAFLTGRKLP